jgi:uncharacterized protein (DUF3820 family)
MAIKRVLKFGKYKGTNLAEAPPDYLQWLLAQDWIAGGFAADVHAVLYPDVDVWEEVKLAVARHEERHPSFNATRFMEQGKGRTKRWGREVLAKGVAHANKKFRARRSIQRFADSQD